MKPNELAVALSCGAVARVRVTIDRSTCRCPHAHRPTARDLAGAIWLEVQDDEQRATKRAAEGGTHA